MHEPIADLFHQYFEMVPATSEALKTEVYRLRYQVYCVETRYLGAEAYPEGLERDEFDAISDHFLIRHRRSGLYAATTRMILPNSESPDWRFPVEQLAHVERPKVLERVERNRVAEASRFCVSKEFKRRPGEAGTTTGLARRGLSDYFARTDERRTFPHLSVALIACLVRISRARGIEHWYAFMEVALVRLFAIFGMDWSMIGPPIEFHGRRVPCVIEMARFLAELERKNRPLWEFLNDQRDCGETNNSDGKEPSPLATTPIADAARPAGDVVSARQPPVRSSPVVD